MYTVPTGKILFISGSCMASRMDSESTSAVDMYVYDGVAVTTATLTYHVYSGKGQQTTTQYFFPAIEALADYIVRLYNSHADNYTRGTIFGWLEDA